MEADGIFAGAWINTANQASKSNRLRVCTSCVHANIRPSVKRALIGISISVGNLIDKRRVLNRRQYWMSQFAQSDRTGRGRRRKRLIDCYYPIRGMSDGIDFPWNFLPESAHKYPFMPLWVTRGSHKARNRVTSPVHQKEIIIIMTRSLWIIKVHFTIFECHTPDNKIHEGGSRN